MKKKSVKKENMQEVDMPSTQYPIKADPSIGFLWLEEDKIRRANTNIEVMTGYRSEELLSMEFWDIIHPDCITRMRKDFFQIEDTKKLQEGRDVKILMKDKSVRWMFCSIELIPSASAKERLVLMYDITEQKLHRNAPRNIERQKYLLLDSLGEGIIGIGVSGKIIFVNQTAMRLLGFKEDELVDQSIHEIIHHTKSDGTPYDKSECKMCLSYTDGELHHFVNEYLWKKDGTQFPIKCKSSPIKENEKIIGSVVVFSDISNRKKMEEYIIESESRYRLLAENVKDVIWIMDETLTFQYISPSISGLLGYSVEETMQLQLQDILTPDSLQSAMSILLQELESLPKAVQNKGFPFSLELEQIHKDGHRVWVEMSVGFFGDNLSKEHWQILGVSRDVSRRKELEHNVFESEERYRSLVENSPDAIIVHSNGKFDYVNPAALKFIGATDASELVGTSVLDIVHSDYKELVKKRIINGISKNDKLPIIEEKFIRFDGQEVDAEVASQPIVFMGKQSVQVVARDITDRKRAEKALIDSETKLSIIANNTYDWETWQSAEGIYLYISPSCKRISGHSAEEFLVDPNLFFQLIHPDDKDIYSQHHHEATHIQIPSKVEFRIVAVDGTIRWIDHVCQPVFDIDGRFMGTRASNRDMTDQIHQEKEYQTILHTALEGFCSIDLSGKLIEVNDSFCKLSGYTHNETMKLSIQDLSSVESSHFNETHISQIVEHGSDRFESQFKCKNGSHVDLDVSLMYLDVRGGRIYVFLRNITERNNAENALKHSLSLLHATIESTADGILVVSNNRIVTHFNEQFFRMWNVPENIISQRVDKKLLDYVMGQLKDPDEFLNKITYLYKNPEIDSFDVIEFLDGKIFEQYSNPQRIDGKPIGRVWNFRDVTKRKRSEDTLHRLLRAIENIDEIVFITNLDGTITYANPAFEKVYGYSKEETIGKTPRIIKSGKVDNSFYSEFWNKLLTGNNLRGEIVNKTKDQRYVSISGGAYPIFNDQGVTIGFIAIQEDISEQIKVEQEKKTLETQLIQSQKLESIGRLAGGIAHDFNNILGMIQIAAETVEMNIKDNPDIFESIRMIIKAAQRGSSITNELLLFARSDRGELKPISISRMVIDLGKFLEQILPKSISTRVDISDDIDMIMGDAGHIHQVLMNLTVNAKDAMPGGGVLTMSTAMATYAEVHSLFPNASNQKYVKLCVSDTGIGMDEKIIERIFDPFFTTKERGKGTGLGLGIVHGIVKNHSGYIHVKSTIGHGSSFMIFFPSIDYNETESVGIDEYSDSRGNETILYVEDEPMLRMAISSAMKDYGYNVLEKSNGLDALDFYRKNKDTIALIITDLDMPTMNGSDLSKGILLINNNAKIIIVSGYIDFTAKSELTSQGIIDIITKPFLLRDLMKMVRRVLNDK